MALTTDPSLTAPQDHVVQFYSEDDELTAGVVPYLAEAIASGGVAVVIATESHRRAFAEELPEDAVERGALILLDADDAMHSLLVEGRLAPHRFEKVIGDVIRDAADRGGPVHAYGEIVAQLWAEGYANAALELEDLWNQLGREVRFSLYCAYPVSAMATDGEAAIDELRAVCGAHSAVVGTPLAVLGPDVPASEMSRTLPGNGRSPAAARRFVRETLAAWGCADLSEDATVIASELATNAVLHARTEFVITLARRPDGTIRLAVRDASLQPPRQRQAAPLDGSGRGLRLVEAIGAAWGAALHTDGKEVWADLRK